jgi:hypothetical protein
VNLLKEPEEPMKLRYAIVFLGLASCQLYPQWSGEFSAGPADPVNFPPPYVGVGGDHTKAGNGTFTQLRAYSQGQAIGYYSFPFAPTVLPPPAKNPPDPLLLSSKGVAATAMPTPQAYVFDPEVGQNPFPTTPSCSPPANYTYNPQRDEVPYNEQGNVFTVLPSATYSLTKTATWSYEPIVAETPINANNESCQGIKSQATVQKALSAAATPDGNFLAWPIIDPAAAVYRVGETSSTADGISYQHWGWYNHYLIAYLDGGYIPTDATPAADGSPQLRMVAQKLYYPRSQVTVGTTTAAGGYGFGYDVISAPRGGAGYSPICQVFTYDFGATATPAQLPQDAATIEDPTGPYAATIKAASTTYLYCLQVQ